MKPPTGARQRKNDAHRSEIDRNSKNMMSDENVKDMSRLTKELLGSTKTEITRTRRQRKEESVGLFESGGVVRILTRARLNIEYWRYWHHPFRPWPQWKKCLEHTSSKTSRTHTHTPSPHTNSHTHARAHPLPKKLLVTSCFTGADDDTLGNETIFSLNIRPKIPPKVHHLSCSITFDVSITIKPANCRVRATYSIYHFF